MCVHEEFSKVALKKEFPFCIVHHIDHTRSHLRHTYELAFHNERTGEVIFTCSVTDGV